MTDKILIPLFTCLAGLWLGFRLNLGQKAASKRRRFFTFIKQLREKVESTHLREFAFANHLAFPATIKRLPELEAEVVEVNQYIVARRLKRFEAAFSAYKALGQQIGDEEKNAVVKAEMLSLLDELRRCVS